MRTLSLATDWPEYLTLSPADLAAVMRGDLLFDAKNALDPAPVLAAGLRYLGVGRRSHGRVLTLLLRPLCQQPRTEAVDPFGE